MRTLVCILYLALAGLGIYSDARPETQPTSRPTDACASCMECFGTWARARAVELCERFQVPPVTVGFADTPSLTIHNGELSYIAAYYLDCDQTMVIYLCNPLGLPVDRKQLEHYLHHEFLHHLEWAAGVSCQPDCVDHNDEFDRWIKILRLE